MTNHEQSTSGIRRGGAVVLAMCLLFPSLLGSKVTTFATNGSDVTTYKTYEWLPVRVMSRGGLLEDDTHVAPVIRASVNRELARKGYVEVQTGGHMQVMSGGFSSSSTQLEGFMGHWGFDFYWGAWTTSAIVPIQREHRQGTMAVLLIDAETEKAVWGGLATILIEKPKLKGGKLDKGTVGSIDKAIKKIVKKLPKARR